MALQTLDLWDLIRGKPQIDPTDLSDAICQQAAEASLDYRTRLLIRDSLDALRSYWGNDRVERRLAVCPHRDRIEAISREAFAEVGFPTIQRRLMDKTRPEDVQAFLRELGQRLHQEATVCIA